MRTVFGYFRHYKLTSILSPLFKLLEAVFELIVPFVIRDIINIGIANSDTGYIRSRILLLGLFAVVGIICAICAQYFAAYSAAGISSDIRSDLFRRIQHLSVSDYEKIGSGNIITGLTSDVNQIQSGINLLLRLLLRSPFIVFGAMIMAFTINVKMALIFVVIITILGIFVALNMRKAIPAFKDTRKSLDELVSLTDNGLTGVRVIRGFNRTRDDYEEFEETDKKLNILQKRAASISTWLNPVTFLLINLAVCLLIWRGGLKVESGVFLRGDVVALYSYMSMILVELIKLANLIVTVSRAVACAGRTEEIFRFLEERHENAVTIPDSHKPHSIEFNDVSFIYEGAGEYVLQDISFKVDKGSSLGIIGMTGSGKSTVSQLAAGLYSPTSGSITIDGLDIDNISRDSLYGELSLCLQKARMFTGSIAYNISLGREGISEEDIREASGISCSSEIIEGKAEGYDYEISSNGTGLSGGQKQRIGIARSLAGHPGIVIFDDSTSALDAATEKSFLTNLRDMKDRPTVIFVSQKIKTVMNMDRIMLIEDGRIAAIAPHAELLKTSASYRQLMSLQEKEDIDE